LHYFFIIFKNKAWDLQAAQLKKESKVTATAAPALGLVGLQRHREEQLRSGEGTIREAFQVLSFYFVF
jgi:hypothetical protein